jgi:hypothetical protein
MCQQSLISRIASRLSFSRVGKRIIGKGYLTCVKSHKRFVWNDSVSGSRHVLADLPRHDPGLTTTGRSAFRTPPSMDRSRKTRFHLSIHPNISAVPEQFLESRVFGNFHCRLRPTYSSTFCLSPIATEISPAKRELCLTDHTPAISIFHSKSCQHAMIRTMDSINHFAPFYFHFSFCDRGVKFPFPIAIPGAP